MNDTNPLLWVSLLIAASALTVFIVQFVRSRRRGDDDAEGRSGNWWEGPWDEDERR